jgi:T5orf172 domain
MIYFLQALGSRFVKIGHARCVRSRLEHLQIASPREIVILGVIAGSSAKEKELHARFAHLRVRGEWFRYTREIRDFLRQEADEFQPDVHDPGVADTDGQAEWKGSLAAVRPRCQASGRRIIVWVQRFADRPKLVLQWHDPETGKRCSKSAGTSDRDQAELRRADLEAVLNDKIVPAIRDT